MLARTTALVALLTCALVEPARADAQPVESGGKIVRVDDGTTAHCVNGKEEAVWLMLRAVVTKTSRSWLKKDSSVGLVINASVRSVPQSAKAISYPLMAETSVVDYPRGQVAVPIEYTIIDTMALKQGDHRYSGIGVELTLVNKKSATGWGVALQTLAKVSKKLPIPSDPWSHAGSYLLQFASDSLDADLANQNANDKAKSGTLDLAFSPNGECGGTAFEKTGTKAFVFGDGTPGPTLIPIAAINDYCWSADLTPSFVLKAGKKIGSGVCTDSSGHAAYSPVSNNYTAFVLSALPATALGGSDALKEEVVIRCKANGLAQTACMRPVREK